MKERNRRRGKGKRKGKRGSTLCRKEINRRKVTY